MKKLSRIIMCFVLGLIMLVSLAPSESIAASTTKRVTGWHTCAPHAAQGSLCQYITLFTQGNESTGDIYACYFETYYAHFPNSFSLGTTGSYKIGNVGYCYGTYTISCSFITQWISGAIATATRTLTATY